MPFEKADLSDIPALTDLRITYLQEDLGIIEKVVIKTSQEVISNGVSGNYDTLMTVICE